MKSIAIASLLILSLQIKTTKPQVVVANTTENILYLGIVNPLEALIEKESKNTVILTTDNGSIEKTENSRFVIRPFYKGVAVVNVCKLVKKDTVIIDKREFRVSALPDPEPYIGANTDGGLVKKKFIISQGGIRSFICCDFEAPVQILEYSLLVIRDSSSIGISSNIGARYSDKSINLLNRLQPNDELFVYKLTCRTPDGLIRPLHPMEFTIEQ
jgi:GldM C-terminal domain